MNTQRNDAGKTARHGNGAQHGGSSLSSHSRRGAQSRTAHASHAAPSADTVAKASNPQAKSGKPTYSSRDRRSPAATRLPAVIIAVVVVVVVAVAGVLIYRNIKDPAHELAPLGTSVSVRIAEGSMTSDIANTLWDAGLIERRGPFNKRVTERGAESQLQAGSYVFVSGTSIDEIIDKLIAGAGLTGDKLVVPEGYTMVQIASALEKATSGRITAAEFLAVAADAKNFAGEFPFLVEASGKSLEGFLFPSTYGVDADCDAVAVVRMMLTEFSKALAQVDMSYPQSQGLGTYDFVKLASIVEREGKSHTFGDVASVFFNRLGIGMALQSDATTAYEIGHEPNAQEVNTASAYSTYTNLGLPPTPICNPGLACMQATAVHADTDYFYFFSVDQPDGTTNYYYSKTFEEHDQKWANRSNL